MCRKIQSSIYLYFLTYFIIDQFNLKLEYCILYIIKELSTIKNIAESYLNISYKYFSMNHKYYNNVIK